MATIDDVRRIALALPGVTEAVNGHTGLPGWRVTQGQFAGLRGPTGADLRQLAELGRQWPDGEVLSVRVADQGEKEALLAAEPEALFSIPHFDGYPALLVRLDVVDAERLAELVTDAWLVRVPAPVAKDWLAAHGLA
ncbi:MmcQ/YjbR family DNA-binding protein [Microbacterium sp. K41]|uniref:MmcQ/YjbR family DNA-binding protein n=1 Tax=Microbacterium sp. K41 TaxID=2305437 RepID=UPI00109CA89B|nr:MmcQ/YjbR family DNA-binding protein [Microbacterium sp. K41]